MTQSTITVKYQTTVPKEVRRKLDLRPSDVLRWEVVDDEVRVAAARRGFLERRGSVPTGSGSAVDDIRRARAQRGTEGS
jgi:antitoxin PrlF